MTESHPWTYLFLKQTTSRCLKIPQKLLVGVITLPMTHYDSVPGQASGLSQSPAEINAGRPQKHGLPLSLHLNVGPTSQCPTSVRIVPSGRSCDDWCVDWRPLHPAPGSATQRQPAGAEVGSLPPSQLETHLPPIVGLESHILSKKSPQVSKKCHPTTTTRRIKKGSLPRNSPPSHCRLRKSHSPVCPPFVHPPDKSLWLSSQSTSIFKDLFLANPPEKIFVPPSFTCTIIWLNQAG